MSGKPQPLELTRTTLLAVYQQARAAFPHECCGWLTGSRSGLDASRVRPCNNAQDSGDHPTAADRSAETAYVIAGPDLLAFDKSFDEPSPAKVIYHSHPNGRAYFSETDRIVATSPWGDGPAYPVQQLVIGLDEHRVTESALFAWCTELGGFTEVARFPGEAL